MTEDKGTELRMPSDEFDRMMRGAIQAAPPKPSKPKIGGSPKGTRSPAKRPRKP